MTRRRILILGLALAGAAALVWVVPACRYRILGVVKREPFFQGMPASYWRDRFLQFEACCDQKKREWEAPLPCPPSRRWLRDSLEEKLPAIASREVELPDLAEPEAIPVLIVLLLDEDPLVSLRGCDALSVIGEPAVPALVGLLQNRSPKVRLTAVMALNHHTDHAASAIAALREVTKDVDKAVALEAIATLAHIDAGSRDSAVAAVIALLNNQNTDRRVREEAVGELGNLCLCYGGLGEQAQAAAVSALREASGDGDKGVAERARVVMEAIVRPAGSER